MDAAGNGSGPLGASNLSNTVLSFSFENPAIWSLAAVVVSLISYFFLSGPKARVPSSKAERAKAMRQAWKSIESGRVSPGNVTKKQNDAGSKKMKISQLMIHPIKSLGGCPVSQAVLTREGFYLDRRFMLLKDDEETPGKLQNMQISKFNNMCLFHTAIEGDKLIVSYRAPGTSEPAGETLDIPIEPQNLDELEKLSIDMYQSRNVSYNMGEECSKWFSDRFGFRVILAYWGGNPRPVLGNLPGKPANKGKKEKSDISKALSKLPIVGSLIGDDEDGIIAFNDIAPYLILSQKSVANVSDRLPEGMQMDYTKFRGNILVEGADSAFEEDFWGELTFGKDSKIVLTANCGRCKSLNIDYNTGEQGKGMDGEVLKILQKDRRVDPGVKYNAIFGRYGFVSRASEGKILSVGDEVVVSKKNTKRALFYWPGIGTPHEVGF